MPQALGLFLFTLGAPIGLVNAVTLGIGGALAGTLGQLAISVGLSALSSLLTPRPQQPKPEDVQQSFRQNASPRIRHVGRVKTSGIWTFAETNNGQFHKVLALGVGPIDAIESYWVDDKQVTIDGSGTVTTAPYTGKVKIQTRSGLTTESAYSDLVSTFGAYTNDMRGDYVASMYAVQLPVGQGTYLDLFPNGIQTLYRVVMRGAKLVPIGGGSLTWSDNPADITYDYMISDWGLRLPADLANTPQALAIFNRSKDRANAVINLADGGTEKKYVIGGSYRLDERPSDVLSRMMNACDARIVQTSDGGMAVDVRDWYEPTVVIDQTIIQAVLQAQSGRDVLETANTITSTYTNIDGDYQSDDAEPWVNEDDVTLRGQIVQDIPFLMSQSFSQTRRLMKKASYELNPQWTVSLQCSLEAVAAIGEDLIRIQYPPFGINEVFRLQDIRMNIEDGDILSSITIDAISMPSESDQWDATQEQGSAPVSVASTAISVIPTPANLAVTINASQQAEITFDAADNPSLTPRVEAKSSASTTWTQLPNNDAKDGATSFTLASGVSYDFRVAFETFSGKLGDFTSVVTVVNSATLAPPPQTFLAVGATSQSDLSWTNANDPNVAGVKFYRNTSNDFATATDIGVIYGGPNLSGATSDTGLSAGTYYYWAVGINAYGNEGTTQAASGAVTVT